MNTNPHNFQHQMFIPVPLGENVYTFWSKCCDACTMQHRHNKAISCRRTSPCHTLKYKIAPVTLSYDNLKEIIDDWGTFYFASPKEAEEAGNARILSNIQKMRDLGYAVDNDGTARHIMTESQARAYNKEHYGHEVKVFDVASKNFKQAYLDGDVSEDVINTYIDYWHTHELNVSLREFLGMSEKEYTCWAMGSDMDLGKILGKI